MKTRTVDGIQIRTVPAGSLAKAPASVGLWADDNSFFSNARTLRTVDPTAAEREHEIESPNTLWAVSLAQLEV